MRRTITLHIYRISLEESNSRFSEAVPAVEQRKKTHKEKKRQHKKKVYPYQNVLCWFLQLVLLCHLLCSLFLCLEGNLAGRAAAKDSSCPPRKKGGQTMSCFSPKLSEGKKKHGHVDHIFRTGRAQETPSEALMEPQPVLVHGNH